MTTRLRTLLRAATAVLAVPLAVGLLGVAPAVGEELKMSHFMSPKHPMDRLVMRPLSEEIAKRTDGEVTVKLFTGGVMGKPPAQYNSAVNHVVDIAFGLHGYTPGRFPLTSVMELPFIVDDSAVGARVLWELHKKYMQDEYDDVHVLMLWQGDPAVFMTTDTVIEGLDDVQGLKLRAPSAGQSAVVEALGATSVSMPITEVYTSMERGVIDGAMTPMSTVRSFKFFEVVNHYHEMKISRSTFFLVMNQDAWDGLSADARQAFNATTGMEASMRASSIYEDIGRKNKSFAQENGGTFHTYDAAERQRWEQAVRPIYDDWVEEMESKGLPGREVLQEAQRLAEKYSS